MGDCVLEFVVVEELAESFDFCGLEEADHVEVVAHEDLAVAGQLGDHGFLDVVGVSRLQHVPQHLPPRAVRQDRPRVS
jgi:hypothetical protein